MEDYVLDCHKCGCPAEHLIVNGMHNVICRTCSAKLPMYFDTKGAALEAWNNMFSLSISNGRSHKLHRLKEFACSYRQSSGGSLQQKDARDAFRYAYAMEDEFQKAIEHYYGIGE